MTSIPKMFGVTVPGFPLLLPSMPVDLQRHLATSDAPTTDQIVELDVRELGPPKPLTETLERLETMDSGVLVQYNDRVPQFLSPKLEDRGYTFETVETADAVVTTIWKE